MDGAEEQKMPLAAAFISQPNSGRRRNWAARLEEVLSDFEALQRFQCWLGVDDDSSEHPLRLHFAIIAYRQMSARGDERAAQLAREIFIKFLRPRAGLCDFIDTAIRERVGQRLKGAQLGDDLFGECLPQLEAFLRKQHALFVQSADFLELFNDRCSFVQHQEQPSCSFDQLPPPPSSSVPFYRPSTSSATAAATTSQWPQTPAGRRSRRRDSNDNKLTADTLLHSQREREAMVPTGGAGLFKPVSKFPYVGQAQTSKKDSAVSSSFSSEANRAGAFGAATAGGTNYSMRQLREGQRRTNQQQASLLNTFPRPEQTMSALRVEPLGSGMPPTCHETLQGRREFAEKLAQKLRHVELQLQQEESVNQQIDRINSARQKGANTSTRELIIASGNDPLLLDDSAADADDDVENYFRRRMMDSSSANSAQQSPPLVPQSRRTRRKSRGSCSPGGAERGTFGQQQQPPSAHQQQQQQFAFGGVAPVATAFSQLMMSQSCYHPMPTAAGNAYPSMVPPPPQTPFGTVRMGHHRGPFPTAGGQVFPTPAAFFGPSGASFAHPPQVPSSSASHHHPPTTSSHHHHLPSSALSQSVHLAGPSAIPVLKQLTPAKMSTGGVYCDNDGDTSGIGSMTTTHSGNSAPGGTTSSSGGNNDKHRAAMFRRARELSSGGREAEKGNHPQQQTTATLGTPRGSRRDHQQMQTQFALGGSLLRPNAIANHPFADQQQQSVVSKMVISCRDSACGDGVPVVAHVPQRPLTFREFRRYLSISSKDRRQFFFKTACEDGTAPYQLLLITDDSALLPMSDGKVSAECRAPLSDSD